MRRLAFKEHWLFATIGPLNAVMKEFAQTFAFIIFEPALVCAWLAVFDVHVSDWPVRDVAQDARSCRSCRLPEYHALGSRLRIWVNRVR